MQFCARRILADRLGLLWLTHLGYCLFQVEYETYESKPTIYSLCLKRHMNFPKKVVCYQLKFEKVLPMLMNFLFIDMLDDSCWCMYVVWSPDHKKGLYSQ